ncbi:MAG: alcohol dehydrogenase catalytic domain-containing protein [Candidatus Eremiobacteraeota bacterium]|nr:alcohol dehydrogenase catalytic domain-containing protein [Candidatus Eremiobacteraeota bacterium]
MRRGVRIVNAGGVSRVAMLVAPRQIELRDEPVPAPAAGEIVVRVRAALTDGTDLKAYRRGHPRMPMPTRFGHEFSGEVAAVGEGVTTFRGGDAVMCAHTAPCGRCFWCRGDQEELCEQVMPTMLLGAYADYLRVPAHIVARNCFPKPDGVSFSEGAFLEPLACVVHSVALLDPKPGSIVVVIGNGGFGILHALLLAKRGVRPLLAGRRQERTTLAQELDIETIDTNAQPLRESLLERTAGRGADAVVECTGSAAVWESAPDLVRRGGTVSFFGGLPSDARVEFTAARLHYDEIRLMSPFHFAPCDVREAYELIASHALPVMRLVSDSYRLSDIVTVFSRLDAGEGMKMLIEP